MFLKGPNRMTNETYRTEGIDENRAAFMLGLPKEQLLEICEFSGLGHLEEGVTDIRMVLTYEEMYKLCRLLVGPTS